MLIRYKNLCKWTFTVKSNSLSKIHNCDQLADIILTLLARRRNTITYLETAKLQVNFGLNLKSGLFVQLDGGAAPSRAPYPYRKTKETQWYCSLARKMTTTTESRKILDIHVMVNWHLSKRTLSYRLLKFRAHRDHVALKSGTLTAGSCQVNL